MVTKPRLRARKGDGGKGKFIFTPLLQLSQYQKSNQNFSDKFPYPTIVQSLVSEVLSSVLQFFMNLQKSIQISNNI